MEPLIMEGGGGASGMGDERGEGTPVPLILT